MGRARRRDLFRRKYATAMRDPFSDFSAKAFSPFFDTSISVEGNRKSGNVAGTYNACVFDNGFADPMIEVDGDTTVRTYSIMIKAGDWLEERPPQIGDRITIGNSTDCARDLPLIRLAVSSVDSLLGDTWSMTATEVSP